MLIKTREGCRTDYSLLSSILSARQNYTLTELNNIVKNNKNKAKLQKTQAGRISLYYATSNND